MILVVKYQNSVYPIIRIEDKSSGQVMIRFIHTSMHWTVHKATIIKEDQNMAVISYAGQEMELLKSSYPDLIIFTAYNEKRPPGGWDNEIVGVARKLGLNNPERHKNYEAHNPLPIISNVQGYNLGSHRLNLQSHPKDDKYLGRDNIIEIGQSELKNPMMDIILSTENNQYHEDGFSVETSLGKLFFKIGLAD